MLDIKTDKIVFYTQYCLLITLLAFVLTKLFKSKATLLAEKNNLKKNAEEKPLIGPILKHDYINIKTCSMSTQTDVQPSQNDDDDENNNTRRKRTISCNKSIQTPINAILDDNLVKQPKRTVNQCLDFLREKKNIDDFLEEEIFELVRLKHIPLYKLESYFSDPIKGIYFRLANSQIKFYNKIKSQI
jgi:hypothetical protein